jgi:glycosyltransferase involved in cell wall biosynthesis
MRIALLSPWYLANGGGTKVVSVVAKMFPNADLFSLFARDQGIPQSLKGRTIQCSFLDRVPYIEKIYRPLLPVYPLAVESLDLTGYDLVISFDASCIKGVLVDQQATHICYCHTPMRYVWDLYRTFEAQVPAIGRWTFALTANKLRLWDFVAAQRVNSFIANSQYIRNRIHHYYRRDSEVIYPPVDTQRGYIATTNDDYYFSVGRLTHTKRLELLIEACNRLERRLVIAGSGREEARLKAIAGKTIEFVGRVSDQGLDHLYAHCRALLFAAEEDFGIVPVEAQAYGRPVIAFGSGGVMESVKSEITGVFFPRQTADSVARAIQDFERIEHHFDPQVIQKHARGFDTSIFVQKMDAYIQNSISHDREGMLI